MSVSMKHAQAYRVYLNSGEWGKRRKGALERARGMCERCRSAENLQVHHLSYERLGRERPEDLRVLCEPCHADEHGLPSKNDRVLSLAEAFVHSEWYCKDAEADELAGEQLAILDAARNAARQRGSFFPS